MTKKQKNRNIERSSEIFEVLLDWYPVELGGRKQIPLHGIYYCTTEIIQDQEKLACSIAIQIDESSMNKVYMWFLIHDDERKVHTGQFLDLFEGLQCVGRVLVGKRLNRE